MRLNAWRWAWVSGVNASGPGIRNARTGRQEPRTPLRPWPKAEESNLGALDPEPSGDRPHSGDSLLKPFHFFPRFFGSSLIEE
jgi:hypothetical protein